MSEALIGWNQPPQIYLCKTFLSYAIYKKAGKHCKKLPSRILARVRSNYLSADDLCDIFRTQPELLQRFLGGAGVAELIVDAHSLYGSDNPALANHFGADALCCQ